MARLTNVYVEVAGIPDEDALRIYKQNVSVLFYPVPPVGEEVDDPMTLTSNATVVGIYRRTITSTLNVTQSGVSIGVKNLSCADVLSFSQSTSKTHTEAVESVLDIVDLMAYFNYIDDKKHTGDTLNIVQYVVSLSAVPAEHTLNLVSTANGYGPYRLLCYHHLGLAHTLPTPFFIDIEDELSIVQYLLSPVPVTANTTVNLTDLAYMSFCVDTLALVSTVTQAKAFDVEHEMDFDDTVVVQGNFMRLITDSMSVGHALTWFEDTPCNRKNYTPFQGENTSFIVFAPPPATLPITQGDASVDRLTLYYPSRDAIASQLILRAPELDNRDRNAYTRVTRETRGGSLIVFADPLWPHIRTMVVTVVGLTSTEVDDYLAFMTTSLGRQIEILDWEGRLWKGIITNPNNAVTQDGKDRFTVSFDFEGEMYEEELPETLNDGFALALSDSADFELIQP